LGKFSCGLLGYKGPKKHTVFARRAVLGRSGDFMTEKSTGILSICFTTRVKRWNKKSIRDLSPNLTYVLEIRITYSRPHGFKKNKNRRRT
jgi:hypothetical protein